MSNIFKILDADTYRRAQQDGIFHGAEIDLKDGYIHFSTAVQVQETAAKHFAGREALMLLALDPNTLGDNLKWEPSRGGQLFPHLYTKLDMRHVIWARPLPWNGTSHTFPPETFE